MNTVFVYGTLKVGGYYANIFDEFRVESFKATLEGYTMYDFGNFPGIVDGDGEIIGEVHTYDNFATVLKTLDNIEGYFVDHPKESLYLRKEAEVKLEDGSLVKAYVYVFNEGSRKILNSHPVIKDGIWKI